MFDFAKQERKGRERASIPWPAKRPTKLARAAPLPCRRRLERRRKKAAEREREERGGLPWELPKLRGR